MRRPGPRRERRRRRAARRWALLLRSSRLAHLALLSGVVTAFGLVAGCGEGTPPEWHEEDGYRWRELRVRGGDPGFTSVDPARAGIGYRNDVPTELVLESEILTNGSGVAIGDVDGDGRPDLFLPGIAGGSALYRNLGDWRFEDVTAAAGLALDGRPARGATFADVDGDGHLDLLVTLHAEPDRLYLGDGAGGFEDVSARAGLESERSGHSLALADTDGDGDLDLYITNYKDRWARDVFSPAELAFDRVFVSEGDSVRVRPEFEGLFRARRGDEGWQRWEFAQPDDYYRNEGEGRFRRVPLDGGAFLDEDGRPLEREPDEWGLSARFADLDGDGDPDLYVCNDLASPDHIWLNQGDGTFRAAPRLAIRSTSLASMAVDLSDVDADGDPDVLVAEMLSRDPVQRRVQIPDEPFDPARPGEVETRPQVNRNTLQLNRGDGTFAEIARYAGLAASGWTWGVQFLDVDLDGYEDLLVANGHALDFLNADAQAAADARARGPDWRRAKLAFPRLEVPNAAFRNLGNLRFEEAGARWSFGAAADISHGLASGDLDGDGDQDVVVNRLDASPLLLRNETGAPRVAVRLRGRPPNTGGVGAVVTVTGAGLPLQVREIAEGGLYLSDAEGSETFAAGEAASLELSVRWPGGAERRIEARPNRLYELFEPEAGVPRPGPAPAPDRDAGRPARPGADPSGAGASGSTGPPRATPLFRDASALIAHRHTEPLFDEFARQPLLPLRLSQLGPGVSWIDIDRDGDPDLVVGAAGGRGPAVFRNDGGAFRALPAPGTGRALDLTTILPLPGPGGTAGLLAGQSQYEAATAEAARSAPSALRFPLGAGGRPLDPVEAVPGGAAATGPLAMADVDGDGDLDLFVGGRVIPTAYPVPAPSRLFLRDGAGFREDAGSRDLLASVGLVSGATFSDVDADGDPDLWLAVEWGPPRLLRNDGGRFVEATRRLGLDALVGRWNGVATGDLDGDGRPDAVLTGWGENTSAATYRGTPALVYGDFDRNGTLDLLEARRTAPDTLWPLLRLDQLARGLPALGRMAPDHRTFAARTVGELLGRAPVAGVVEAAELRHLVLLNRGDRFEARPLPPEAQFAPAFGIAVADLDGDGNEDVVLAQNFFAPSLDAERLDAGRGLWLRGDGAGGLEAVHARESGIEAYGDGRGLAAADFDGDGRLDLAIGQNGSETKLYRNVGGRPGLRVRLVGPEGNPAAVGAALRLVYPNGRGPVREVKAGSGYWSQDGAVQVLGLRETPRQVWVRWPDGTEMAHPLDEGAREVVIWHPATGSDGGHLAVPLGLTGRFGTSRALRRASKRPVGSRLLDEAHRRNRGRVELPVPQQSGAGPRHPQRRSRMSCRGAVRRFTLNVCPRRDPA